MPVAEEETTRLERERPPEAEFGGLYAGFFGGLGVFLLVYLFLARLRVLKNRSWPPVAPHGISE